MATRISLGFAALRGFLPGLQLEPSKLFELTKTAGLKRGPRVFADTMRLVSCAKNWGLVPKRDHGTAWKASILPDTPESWLALQDHFELWEADLEAARDILKRSNEQFWQERKLDFDDMVYLPVALGLQVFASSKMIVDEAQDLSPLNLKMLSKTPAKVWYVGDPYQAIYSWRGAAEDTLGLLGLPELPLTVCWRCAKNIISELSSSCLTSRQGRMHQLVRCKSWTGCQTGKSTRRELSSAGLMQPSLALPWSCRRAGSRSALSARTSGRLC